PEWLERARKAADLIWESLTEEVGGSLRIKAVYYEGVGAQIEGYLHDYALAAEAFLAVASKVAWIDPAASSIYQERAKACIDTALQYFSDQHTAGFYFTAEDADTPVARRKEWFDNATPSGNAVMLHALAGLYALTGEGRYIDAIQSTLPAYT
ncbi:MAG: hypothetical protein NWR36_03325, partial [Opitutales bacterium]|nr:hypothetical protein [Opitutales bacterium]